MSKAAAKRAFQAQRDQYVAEVVEKAMKGKSPLGETVLLSHASHIPEDMRLFVLDRAYDVVEARMKVEAQKGK